MQVLSRMKKILGAFLHAPGRFDELAKRVADTNGRIDDTEIGFREQVSKLNAGWFTEQLSEDRELLQKLNRGLSIAPTVWGDPDRLEIDETAKVFTCFFNTNSGRIKIGEATFAGSGVSILAGSHDPQLTGELRRDAEATEGCDIEIGRGVWLASGCTLLGPCRVGDNAVIAAGAVVTPGTEVPEGTIWGGVPAKQIGTLELKEMNAENPAVKAAFARSEGILFTDGWGERISGILETPGNWFYKDQAGILTDRANWRMSYRKDGSGSSRIRLEGPEGTETLELTESEGEKTLRLPVREGEMSRVTLTKEKAENIFIALTPAESLPETEAAKGPATADTAEEGGTEDGSLDIEAIMEEIRAEARKRGPYEEAPGFDQMPKQEEISGPALRLLVEQLKVSESNQALKAALETAARLIEKQQAQIDELKAKIQG